MKQRLVIVVSGGLVQSVHAEPGLELDVTIADCDNMDEEHTSAEIDAEIDRLTADLVEVEI